MPTMIRTLVGDRSLLAATSVAAILRFWRIRGDLPYVFHYDEPTLVDNAVWLWQHHTLNPHFFNYPTGFIYLLAALFGAVLALGLLFGRFAGAAGAMSWLTSGTYARPPEGGVLYFYPTVGVPILYVIARCVSALFGLASVILVHAVALRAGASRTVARMAAWLLALSPLAVEHARLATTDSAAMAAATACLLVVIAAERGGARAWIAAGALGGLAAGFKYNAGLVVLVLPVLAAMRMRGERGRQALSGPAPRMQSLRLLAIAAASAIAVFFVTTPFALLDFGRFARDLGYEFRRVGSVTESFQGQAAIEKAPLEKIAGILWHNLGVPAWIAGIWGIVAMARTRRFGPIAILCWVAIALLPQLRWQSLYARYLLPPWPALLILVAWGIEDAAGRIGAAFGGARRRAVAVWALSIIVLAPGTIRLVERESRRARPDPRIEMTHWVEANVPPGERLAIEPGGAFPPAESYSIHRYDFLGRNTPDLYRAHGIRYLLGSGRESRVKGEAAYAEVIANLERIRSASDVLWSDPPYTIYKLRGGAAWEDEVAAALARGDTAAARRTLEDAVRSGGGTPHAWKQLAALRADTADPDGARAAYAEAARLDPGDAEAPLALANLAIEARSWDEALQRLADALRAAPRDPLVRHNFAVVYLYRAQDRVKTGNRSGAREDWDLARENAAEAAKFAPGDPQMTGIVDQVARMGVRWGFTAP